jgi:hypothetical protein
VLIVTLEPTTKDVVALAVAVLTDVALIVEVLTDDEVIDVAVIADAFTAVEFAVKLPLTVIPFFTMKLLLAISVPCP